MKKIFLFLPVVALLAVGCNSLQQLTNQEPVQTQVAQNTKPSSSTDWSIFTNPQDGYSIQYPSNLGSPIVINNPDGAQGVQLTWTENDLVVFIGFEDLTTKQWLISKGQLNPDLAESVSVNGLKGTLYNEKNGVQRIFLNKITNGTPIIYYLYFGNAPGTPLPVYWRQMLNSFKSL